jgi:PAS domain S-box-containing protein
MDRDKALQERIIILAPVGRDGELLAEFAHRRGYMTHLAQEGDDLEAVMSQGAGAVVVTEEALQGTQAAYLGNLVAEQPEWSDLQFIVISSPVNAAERQSRIVRLSSPLRNFTLIERPVRLPILANLLESAIRDRRRQYALRDSMESLRASEVLLRARETQLRTALLAAGLGSWSYIPSTGRYVCSEAACEMLGLDQGSAKTLEDVLQCIHPGDRDAYQAVLNSALRRLSEFQVQHRILWRNNTTRWILVRGRALEDDGDGPYLAGVMMDVTERRAAEQAVEESERKYRELSGQLEQRVHERTIELVEANREMEGFTYSVSHDLRAPIRAMVANSVLLRLDYGDLLPPEALELLKEQEASGKKLAKLIDDLLRLSRLSRQAMGTVPLDVSSMASDIVSEMRSRGEAPIHRFEIQPGIRTQGDPTLIRLVIENLLENAVKFSPQGGCIEVGQEETDRGQAVFVRDQGIGFDMRYAEKVFMLFERLVGESQFVGTGVGLANVKRIIERHNGEVWAESEPGKGATFYFTLPVRGAALNASQ